MNNTYNFLIYLFLSIWISFNLTANDQENIKETAPYQFKKVQISSESFESAGVFDVNQDGHLDIVSGAFWYEGPSFIDRYYIGDIKRYGEYWDDFSTIPMDVNGDGKTDYITGGWFGENIRWFENPGDNSEWTEHVIDQTGHVETMRAWDVDGDGHLEIVPNNPSHPLKYYKLERDRDGIPLGTFKKVTVAETQGHGLGFGDINGNGRGDFVMNNGWLEAPSDPVNGTWILHEEFDFSRASVPILVLDVNGDGLNDLIVGQAHDYGLYWYEQSVDSSGNRSWVQHLIDPDHAQFHTMEWVDLDGAGQHVLISGKRYRAHNSDDPGANDPIGLFYYIWDGDTFVKHTIALGPLGVGKGTGIYFSVADLRDTGYKDIIVAGKDGLYVFFNEGTGTN